MTRRREAKWKQLLAESADRDRTGRTLERCREPKPGPSGDRPESACVRDKAHRGKHRNLRGERW